MIRILIVDDNPSKLSKIRDSILSNHPIEEDQIDTAVCKRDASGLLYKEEYDLLILDLVLPIEENGESLPKNGIDFLNEILINPNIKPPIHVLGISGFRTELEEASDHFTSKLWNLIEYEESSTAWEEKLNSIIFHLVKVREKFIRKSIGEQFQVIAKYIEDNNLPNTFSGLTYKDIMIQVSDVVERTLEVPFKFSNGTRARNINVDSLKISSEYDFQNLIHLALRPWMPSTEPENVAVIFDGNSKNADFSIKGNSIIIEAKYIDSTGKKNDTLKTLDRFESYRDHR
jgi:CheY-like chemotaxis protein